MSDFISEENLEVLNELGLNDIFKNSLEKRIVVIGDSDYHGDDLSEFINNSEYVVRTDYGRNITNKKLGHKTDILYIDKSNFTPFDSKSMNSNFDNYLYKKCFDDCREIWLPIHKYLINEELFKTGNYKEQPRLSGELIKSAWDNSESREVLFNHVKHLYMHNKVNIKMLDEVEFGDLYNLMHDETSRVSKRHPRNIEFISPSPFIYCIFMSLSDSRFQTYSKYCVNMDEHKSIDLTVNGFDYYIDTFRELEQLKGYSGSDFTFI